VGPSDQRRAARRAAERAEGQKPGQAWRVYLRAADVGTERSCIVRVLSVEAGRMGVLVCGALVEIEVAWKVGRVKRAETAVGKAGVSRG